ncbi:YeeE/YedE family protein [Nisaea acidiphila]|uniref:YeeE/YedE family protein n=1 Tax=Nisaea acidiphila TaxID=1862145 RepID=A0A9J7AM82_9PROT|nr:YeeE/YedE family protein [Nisaea acidiphila]UUX48262.1 YeeE/YedE family protein [Nisaea acidiphila]
MSIAVPTYPLPQKPLAFTLGAIFAAIAASHLLDGDLRRLALFAIGGGLGVALYHAAFGFTAAYRNLIQQRDLSGIVAQAVMLTVAMVLFATVLSDGEAFGFKAGGAVAPLNVALVTGAFIFGLGMQIAGGCASGTLFTAGGGNARMVVVLIFFCAGSFWGSLDLPFWRGLPSLGAVSLGRAFGYPLAVLMQVGALCAILGLLWLWGARMKKPLWDRSRPFGARAFLQGPWPLLLGAIALAVLNYATLLAKGFPWGVTWGFTLWGAKAAEMLGWDPNGSAFWAVNWRQGALHAGVLEESTSLMNIGIILGAGIAASLAGKVAPVLRMGWRPFAAAVIGGLMLGYGARLAYGCNIGAFFSGIASTSLHGWVWIAVAIVGNVIGVRLRPFFRLG